MELPRLAYIAGCTHSGTTLVNRILGAHPQILSVGGLKNLPEAVAGRLTCSCGEISLLGCPFWGAVDSVLRGQGLSLAGLQVDSPDAATFAHDNLALLKALRAVSGAKVVIDTSRRAQRLRRLKAITGLAVVPLLLFKDPRSQVSSYRRKSLGLRGSLKTYWRDNLSVLSEVTSSSKHIVMQYEDFCRNPSEHLSMVLDQLGVDQDVTLLNRWGAASIHMLGGNRMKSGKSSNVSLDESWRQRLQMIEWLSALAVGFPVLAYCRRHRARPQK